MPTVIDALVVELGLDPKNFIGGQKEIEARLKRLIEEARKGGNEIESHGKKTDHYFKTLKAGVAGVLAGYSASATLGFINNMNRTDAALGRTSYVLNMNAQQLAVWQAAAKRTGGSAEGLTSTFQALSGDINSFAIGAGGGAFLGLFNSLGIGIHRANGELRTMDELLLDVAEKLEQQGDPARRAAFLAAVPGMTPDVINLLIKGRKAAEDTLEASRKAAKLTDEQIAAAQKYQAAMSDLETSATSLWRSMVNLVSGPLTAAFAKLAELLQGWNVSPDTPEGRKIVQEGHENLRRRFGTPADLDRALGEAFGNPGYNFFQRLAESLRGEGPRPLPSAPAAPSAPAPGPRGGTRADRNNNPGNIKFGPFAQSHGATGADGNGFAVFPSREVGFAAAEALLNSKAYRNLTLPQIGHRWAEGDPNWAANAARATGLPMDRALTDEERRRLARFGTVAAEGSKLAPFGAGAGAGSGGGSGGASTVNQTTHVGTIVIHTEATDADGIARGIGPAIRRGATMAPANYGPE